LKLKWWSAFRDRAAIINGGVPILKGFIRYDVWHEQSPLEVDRVAARRNAEGIELAAHAVIADPGGCAFTGYKMQFHAPVADDSISYCHDANMLRQRLTSDES